MIFQEEMVIQPIKISLSADPEDSSPSSVHHKAVHSNPYNYTVTLGYNHLVKSFDR
jgi:hypothetical protein